MSTMAAAMPNKLRVLPGSVDLLIAYPSYEASTESAGGSSASAVAWLNSSLQLARSIPSELLSASAVSLPPSVSAPLWQYEQLRSILCDLNALLASLAPHCTAAVCPVMVATADWEFLCAAHGSKPLKVKLIPHTYTHSHTLTHTHTHSHDQQPAKAVWHQQLAGVMHCADRLCPHARCVLLLFLLCGISAVPWLTCVTR